MSQPGAPSPYDPTPGRERPRPQEAPDQIRGESRSEAGAAAFAPAPAPRRRSLVGIAVVGLILAGLALLLVAGYFLLAYGPTLTVIGGLLALIPLTIVLLGVRWIDRWEPEPRPALAFAFLWGAGTSIVIALVVDLSVQVALAAVQLDPTSSGVQFLQYTVQAPVVEEFGKGLAVLLLFLFARRHFDGPVDGVVYAAMAGAGFAFTENIQYFGNQIATAGGLDGSVAGIVFVRGILSPFAHVMFTAMIGLAVGWAAQRYASRGPGVLFWLLGLLPAIFLHALWNGGAVLATNFYAFYAVVQVPLFVLAIVMVNRLRAHEARLTQARLAEYAEAGWINHDEVPALGTPAGRRTAKNWADRNGRGQLMRRYIRDATRLAFARQRIIVGRDRIGAQADEAVLLQAVTRSRRALLGG